MKITYKNNVRENMKTDLINYPAYNNQNQITYFSTGIEWHLILDNDSQSFLLNPSTSAKAFSFRYCSGGILSGPVAA